MQHVPTDAEEDDPAGDLKCVRRNSEKMQDERAEQRERHHDHESREYGASQCGTAVRRVVMRGHGHEDRDGAERVEDRQQRSKREGGELY